MLSHNQRRSSPLLALAAIAVLGQASASICQGNVILTSQADYDYAKNCTEIQGSLTIEASFNGSIIALPELVAVGALVAKLNEAVQQIGLPSLQSVNASVEISGNDALSHLEFPALASVGSDFSVDKHIQLANISAPVLESIGGTFKVFSNEALSTVSMPKLASIGESLQVSFNDALGVFDLPDLAVVGGDYAVISNADLDILSTKKLESIGGYLMVTQNALTRLYLTNLREVLAPSSRFDWTLSLPVPVVATNWSFLVDNGQILYTLEAPKIADIFGKVYVICPNLVGQCADVSCINYACGLKAQPNECGAQNVVLCFFRSCCV
eukprot:CAMPEP_0176338970 /NCGR_PEP_ID=MMETSP0126-20121128/386_1 /TAXON_ID=141414 ORGANISM="Strombidinopsis acuminatum, Strain SPMC142" /NCGR_SAMPLE_ID=MMETSP0126 /ASSEMBLY_ACC=CAM_ASM_000229 /LENGTH=324 /DNA_ID=CAMNT_0017682271 /DNA_START=36 /DNA_END=1010 /DNA_ORIENTATION=+